MIRDIFCTTHWHYVRPRDKPADSVSRGLIESRFFEGPVLLYQLVETWESNKKVSYFETDDPEVKSTVDTFMIQDDQAPRFESISSWEKMKRVMNLVLKFN